MRRASIAMCSVLLGLAALTQAVTYKNTAGQKVFVYAYDKTTGAGKTGDAGNITARICTGGHGTVSNDANPTEADDTNCPGLYVFDLTQAETNHDVFAWFAKSSTSNIVIDPVIVSTTPVDSNGNYPSEVQYISASANVGVAGVNYPTLTQLNGVRDDIKGGLSDVNVAVAEANSTISDVNAALAVIRSNVIASGTVASYSSAGRLVTMTAGTDFPATADYYPPGQQLIIVDANDGHSHPNIIDSYSAGRVIRLGQPPKFTPAAGDAVYILSGYVKPR